MRKARTLVISVAMLSGVENPLNAGTTESKRGGSVPTPWGINYETPTRGTFLTRCLNEPWGWTLQDGSSCTTKISFGCILAP